MNNETESIECPICSIQCSAASIEAHVQKCLFLSESSSGSNHSKSTLTDPGREPVKSASAELRKTPNRLRNETPRKEGVKRSSSNLDSDNFTVFAKKPRHDTDQNDSTNKNDSSNVPKCSKKFCNKNKIPLAEKMRPSDMNSYVGQSHVVGSESIFFQLLKNSEIQNTILWGPPGCGKTSLAAVVANMCKNVSTKSYRFVKISAAVANINDVKKEISIAINELKFRRHTIMFVDEIHRFNKIQQDTFLPHIEAGNIIIIGATTENPSFSLNKAIISRCKVIQLEKLSVDDLIQILTRAVEKSGGIVIEFIQEIVSDCHDHFLVDKSTIKWLAETSDGDARIALSGLELAIQSKVVCDCMSFQEEQQRISLDNIKDSLKKSHCLYDKKGDEHYNMISALHKSVRASNVNASLYWLTRMLVGGEDVAYIGRRMIRMAAEDIGLADPKALGHIIDSVQSCKELGNTECGVILAQCAVYLARAPKSRLMDKAYRAAEKIVIMHKDSQFPVPLELRCSPKSLKSNESESDGKKRYLPKEIEDCFD
ncbi:ATPase WRNIP1-like [Trichogramma pretiosum]|uniref:ATPase WRNIP1-like n=1 Tax=Trichogramma pretiosum TaxID=7493 RepID=UPI0006C9BD4B|nr:ATPase WRNIP1-like [Trichogramma pretiosum]